MDRKPSKIHKIGQISVCDFTPKSITKNNKPAVFGEISESAQHIFYT